MGKIRRYQQQHKEILLVTTQISAMLRPEKVTENSKELAQLLAKLGGKLSVHLSLETKGLYAELIGDPDPTISQKAKSMASEAADLQAALHEFRHKWATAKQVSSDPVTFIGDAQTFFQTLTTRIHREDVELFPLIESAQKGF